MEAFLKKSHKLIQTKNTTKSKDTVNFAVGFASNVKRGEVIGLTGNLGAGKTHFIKGLAAAFGMKKSEVISPTFGIVREYSRKGILFYHFDFYRLEGMKELDVLGFREYLTDESAVIVIEWADRVKECYEYYDYVVNISHLGGNDRNIKVYQKKKTAVK